MKLIDKDALVAEIDKIIADETESIKSFEHSKNVSELQRSNARIDVLTHLCSLLDTLEVKEVDLEKHLKEDIEDVFFDLNGVAVKGATHCLTVEDVKDIAKHFYELGMVASNKAQKGEEV